MANQVKFITSHRARVKRANEYRRNSPENISIFDREALVEFYLLEDVIRLYEYRLKNEEAKVVETRAGRLAKERNITKFAAIINIFKSAVEIARASITSGNYKAVWKSIPEHALMVAANKLKYLPELRDIAIRLIKTLSDEALKACGEVEALDRDLDAIEDHEANTRRVLGIPSAAEIDELIRSVEVAIPDPETKKRPKANIN